MSYYYCEDYYEPSEFDEKVEEFKYYLRQSIKEETKNEIEKLRKENESLQEIKRNWDNLVKEYEGKTVIIVAHRLSTIKNADQIIVMHNGKIAEVGNHSDLIKNKGAYFQIFTNQISINNIL